MIHLIFILFKQNHISKNLSENGTTKLFVASSSRPVQWNSPKNAAKPGSNWTPQPMAATTGAGYRPMVSEITQTLPFLHIQHTLEKHFHINKTGTLFLHLVIIVYFILSSIFSLCRQNILPKIKQIRKRKKEFEKRKSLLYK